MVTNTSSPVAESGPGLSPKGKNSMDDNLEYYDYIGIVYGAVMLILFIIGLADLFFGAIDQQAFYYCEYCMGAW